VIHMEGIAKAAGVHTDRKQGVDVARVKEMRAGGTKQTVIARELGISRVSGVEFSGPRTPRLRPCASHAKPAPFPQGAEAPAAVGLSQR
jgi:hypothetical protein